MPIRNLGFASGPDQPMPITILDLILLGVMLVSGLLAMVRGFMREVLSIAAWGSAALVTLYSFNKLLPTAKTYFNNDTVAAVVVVAGVFVGTLIVVSVITVRNDTAAVASSTELNMRIVEAQESERLRLVREVHDGPAQALSNAIFQIDYVERVIAEDPTVAHMSCALVGERLRRDLDDVRGFISQSRPAAAGRARPGRLDRRRGRALQRPDRDRGQSPTSRPAASSLSEADQTVVLRIVQEALQNIRKHAAAELGRSPPGSRARTGSSRCATMGAASTLARWPPGAGAISGFNSCASGPN